MYLVLASWLIGWSQSLHQDRTVQMMYKAIAMVTTRLAYSLLVDL